MKRIKLELTEDQAREIITALDGLITYTFPKGILGGKSVPSKDAENAFRLRLIKQLKAELVKL